MQAFNQLTSTLAPLPIQDIDTDQIIPARYLKITSREGLAEGLFSNWNDDPNFVLNLDQYKQSKILLAGNNFGCGSSREHAPWALLDHGFRAVISTRFADIFRGNSLKNGLLPVTVEEPVWKWLLERSQADPATAVTIDLATCLLQLPKGAPMGEGPTNAVSFDIEPLAQRCMLSGTDQFGYLLDQLPKIEQWEASRTPPINTSPNPSSAS